MPPAPVALPAPALEGHWQRLHAATPVVRVGPGLLLIGVILLGQGARSQDRTAELIRLGVLVFFLLLSAISWLVTRWRVAEGSVQIETGLLRRSSLRFPLSQIQAVDIVRPGLARIFGLAELRLRMASGSRSTGRLAYMRDRDAEAVRVNLYRLTREAAPATPASPAGQNWTPIYTVDGARLFGSILLSGPALVLWAVIVGLVALGASNPSAAAGAVAGSFGSLVGLAAATWARVNGLYRLSLGTGPDGLHLRSGLVQTTAETIPWGRIQALRTVQPALWRPFGWYRVEADVAGHNVSGRRDRAAKRAGRALIPVGTRAEAEWLTQLVMPGGPASMTRPPGRARWKSPLRFRNLGYAHNDSYAVTTSGRIRRVRDLVPLAKVQSIRWSEGPMQRRLGLASIHFDTAGRSVYAVARDRDVTEAKQLLAALPDACRAARSARLS